MSAYLLNLIFAKPPVATVATGLFSHDDPTGLRSKVWYTIPAGWPPVPLTQPGTVLAVPPLASWGTPTADSLLSCALGDDIYIRAAPDSSWGPVGQPVPSLSMVCVVAFGRLAGSNHGDATIAAPFTQSSFQGAGIHTPLTLFITPNQSTPAADGSWIYYCGKPAQNAPGQQALGNPPIPSRLCTYSFIVGGQAALGSNVYTYGHDPGMVVKG